jgi:hypothetical protein
MARLRSDGYTARMKIHSILLVVALFGVSGAAIAQWQWLDKDGRKVFSDRAPPTDVPEKSILKRPSSTAKAAAPPVNDESQANAAPAPLAAASRPAGGVDKELEAKKKQAADAELAKRKSEDERITKVKIENCARAKQSKMNFDSGMRMSRTNAAGEREVLDDAARAAELKRIQTVIDSECK